MTRLLIAIRAITDARPTYGYRRVTAILNRTRRATGEPALKQTTMRPHQVAARIPV